MRSHSIPVPVRSVKKRPRARQNLHRDRDSGSVLRIERVVRLLDEDGCVADAQATSHR